MRSGVQRYKHHPWAHNSPLVLESLKPIVAGAGGDVTKDRRSPNSTLRPRLYDMSGSTPAPASDQLQVLQSVFITAESERKSVVYKFSL